MTREITLTIDGLTATVPEGTTILQAAKSVGIEIPAICLHEATTSNGLCRMCVVEIEGWRVLAASCVAQAADRMVVHTSSERVLRSRKTILEMLHSTVDLSESPDIQQMAQDYSIDPARFPDAIRREVPKKDDNAMYIRDYAKCVLCWRCVQVCAQDAQYTFALNYSGRGYFTQISTFFDQPLPLSTCVFCGQCVGVCPTNALKPKREWLLEQGLPREKKRLTTSNKPDIKGRLK